MPQLIMSLNSFNQMRFEEFYEAVAGPFWFAQRQIISGLHVNVGWYGFLVVVYNIFGFSLHTGKIIYLVMAFFSNFALFYLLRRFFKVWMATLILLTITLSPTYLYMNALNLHWALTFHILIVILLLLHFLDFKKKKLSLIITGGIFFLMMWGWLAYQAFVFYIPSLMIFYWWKYRSHLGGVKAHPRGVRLAVVAATAFLLPLIMLFAYVDNRHILIADTEAGGGLFRGGGQFEFSENVFSQAWTDLISDFFVKGVSHHYEVAQAEFSLIFPILTLVLIAYTLFIIFSTAKIMKKLILLSLLVIVFDIFVFSTTSDLGLPGMKRLTPMLVSIYFLWVISLYYLGRLPRPFGARNDKGRLIGVVILSLLTIHHLIVYPINLAYIKEPSPFKVADWFDEENPQKTVDEYVKIAQKQDLLLDCRPIIEKFGDCSYDFIYPAVSGSCQWGHLSCHQIMKNKYVY